MRTESPAASLSARSMHHHQYRRSPRSPSLNPIQQMQAAGNNGSPATMPSSPMHAGNGSGGAGSGNNGAAGGNTTGTRSPSLNTNHRNNKLMGSLSSMSMRSKSSTLSSTKSDSSMQSIHTTNSSRNTISITTTNNNGKSSSKTPKMNRKTSATAGGKDGNGTEEKMITIKCQRLTADRTYEEVEIEVPAPIYETMQTYTETGSPVPANRQPSKSEKRGGLGTKIKCLFSKTAN
eukprot:TRINITY_DN17673_c0_g1_i1.p1 TRINITY_DN17673_c0_g1~~TRINITY_DN17673_c0_g1_i1.p1  ORF type:complete len:261 (+),score=88.82 TRINITY_DN17673_c0_g1_i1:83-784(+)